MVGVGAALHLQKRGPTSSWSSGTRAPAKRRAMQRGNNRIRLGVSIMFPRDLAEIARYALNRASAECVTAGRFAGVLPWLIAISSPPRRIGRCVARWLCCR